MVKLSFFSRYNEEQEGRISNQGEGELERSKAEKVPQKPPQASLLRGGPPPRPRPPTCNLEEGQKEGPVKSPPPRPATGPPRPTSGPRRASLGR